MANRLAGEYLDQCRQEVLQSLAGLRHLVGGHTFERELHVSVSRFLNAEVDRLRRPRQTVVLPGDLAYKLACWKRHLSSAALEVILVRRMTQWRDATLELLRRADHDTEALVQLGVSRGANIAAISEPRGDLHNHGRSVCILTFDDHSRVVYKPRSVCTEATFARIVHWLNESCIAPRLEACVVVPYQDYGWAGFVETRPCLTRADAEVFYERQGAFLALFFILNGGDCLADNFVGKGPHPVWVDTECICEPALAHTEEWANVSPVPTWMRRSILNSCFVFMFSRNGIPPRRLTGLSVSCTSDRSLTFTDNDTLRENYIRAVIRGFTSLYKGVLSVRDAWLAPDGPVSWWTGQHVRRVFRSTRLYASLVEALLVSPENERDELRDAIPAVLRGPLKAPTWFERVIDADVSALERADIPYWTLSTSSHSVTEAGGTHVTCALEKTGMQMLVDRARSMNAQDMENQVWAIDGFLRLPNRTAALS